MLGHRPISSLLSSQPGRNKELHVHRETYLKHWGGSSGERHLVWTSGLRMCTHRSKYTTYRHTHRYTHWEDVWEWSAQHIVYCNVVTWIKKIYIVEPVLQMSRLEPDLFLQTEIYRYLCSCKQIYIRQGRVPEITDLSREKRATFSWLPLQKAKKSSLSSPHIPSKQSWRQCPVSSNTNSISDPQPGKAVELCLHGLFSFGRCSQTCELISGKQSKQMFGECGPWRLNHPLNYCDLFSNEKSKHFSPYARV